MDDKWRKVAIGNRIREARTKAKLSQAQLEGLTGIKYSMISNYETGTREPNLANLAKIAHALKISMDELYYGDDSIRPISNASSYGMKIVNCFSELFLTNTIGRVEEGKSGYSSRSNLPHVILWTDAHSIRRLLSGLEDYKNNISSFPSPSEHISQIKQSVATEINRTHKIDTDK